MVLDNQTKTPFHKGMLVQCINIPNAENNKFGCAAILNSLYNKLNIVSAPFCNI